MKNKKILGTARRIGGFTLMEMMIVVSIIMILSVVGMANFSFSRQKARDAQRKNDLSQIVRALETYVNDFGSYPADDGGGQILGCDDGGTSSCAWGDDFVATYNGSSQIYMSDLPDDPQDGANYYYVSDGVDFALYSTLENNNDPYCRDDLSSEADCGVECKYKVINSGADSATGTDRCDQ
jgi:general secretion pathway protein G